MTAESQTIFSVSLFLALSCLLAWSNRRHRHAYQFRIAVAADLLHGDESVEWF